MNNISDIVISGSVPNNSLYIPVVIGHSKSNIVVDNIFFDGGKWRIYTNCEQEETLRFYKCIK